MARLPASAAAARPDLSLGGPQPRLSRRVAAWLSADRGASAPDPPHLLAIHVAALCRGARAPSGEAQARRPGALDDHHVLRHPRLYESVGTPRSGSSDAFHEQL